MYCHMDKRFNESGRESSRGMGVAPFHMLANFTREERALYTTM